jgi:ribosomal protein L7/L12
VGFSEASAKRLASIVRNGPRCGVFPIVAVDGSNPLPYGFTLDSLEQFATVFRYSAVQDEREGILRSVEVYLTQTAVDPNNKVEFAKAIREIAGLDFDRAMALANGYGLPALLVERVTRERATEVSARLAPLGGTVQIEPN